MKRIRMPNTVSEQKIISKWISILNTYFIEIKKVKSKSKKECKKQRGKIDKNLKLFRS